MVSMSGYAVAFNLDSLESFIVTYGDTDSSFARLIAFNLDSLESFIVTTSKQHSPTCIPSFNLDSLESFIVTPFVSHYLAIVI